MSRPLHDGAETTRSVAAAADRGPYRGPARSCAAGHQRRRNPRDDRQRSAQSAARARHRPDDFLAAPKSFEDYIRYLTARGEFGDADPEAELARLRARFGDHYSFERTRPDGTIIEVRHNPMPEGGFVLIYSDITERKRSEVGIRAARDAAEATLRDQGSETKPC